MTKAWKYLLSMDALTRMREVNMEVLGEREKGLDCNLALVKKELAGVKVENVSLQWSQGNIKDKLVSLENDAVETLTAVAESAQHNVMQDAESVDSAFSKYWERLSEQARWTKA